MSTECKRVHQRTRRDAQLVAGGHNRQVFSSNSVTMSSRTRSNDIILTDNTNGNFNMSTGTVVTDLSDTAKCPVFRFAALSLSISCTLIKPSSFKILLLFPSTFLCVSLWLFYFWSNLSTPWDMRNNYTLNTRSYLCQIWIDRFSNAWCFFLVCHWCG